MKTSQPLVPLADNEQKMLDLMVDGLTIEEIAAELGVKSRTAKYYSDRLRYKFGVTKRRDLIRIARERQDGSR